MGIFILAPFLGLDLPFPAWKQLFWITWESFTLYVRKYSFYFINKTAFLHHLQRRYNYVVMRFFIKLFHQCNIPHHRSFFLQTVWYPVTTLSCMAVRFLNRDVQRKHILKTIHNKFKINVFLDCMSTREKCSSSFTGY